MTEPARIPAPDAVGDIVAGTPPVPITVWYVPAAPAAATMSLPLAQRLIANFTHPHAVVIDLTEGPQVAQAASAARRRHRHHEPGNLASGRGNAALIVSAWPAGQTTAEAYLVDCAARLDTGGCVAVVVGTGEVTVHQMLIAAARTAGLTYLQHIVAAHDLSGRRGRTGTASTHIRVHTDVLVFSLPHGREAAGA